MTIRSNRPKGKMAHPYGHTNLPKVPIVTRSSKLIQGRNAFTNKFSKPFA